VQKLTVYKSCFAVWVCLCLLWSQV